MYDTVSYRQAGTTAPGNVKHGPPPPIQSVIEPEPAPAYPAMRPRVKRAVPSIPSKFETTLHVGQRERNAFGTRTHRFNPSDNELPGPGNYYKPTTFVKSAETCGSVSKLGYGVGFVSKTKRFGEQERRHLQAHLDPAPGQYSAPAIWATKSFSTAPTTGLFAKPRRYRDDKHIIAQPAPGPGDYNPKIIRTATAPPMFAKARQWSTFESRTKRDSYMANTSVAPAPGHYTYDDSSFSKYKDKKRLRPSAAFRSTEARLNNLYPATKLGVPGPGTYLTINGTGKVAAGGAAAGAAAGAAKAPPSSLFGNRNHDRFGRPYNRKTVDDAPPGPGSYYHESSRKRAPASSSVFVSRVHRMGSVNRDVKPPGPAFYKPGATGKKSFLLNAARRWV